MSEVGTNRTNRAGLLISVDRGTPEVSGRRSKLRDCEGFRMTAHHDDAAGAGAVVRKPPVKETAIGGTCGGAAGFELSGLDRCRRDPPAQLLRYGTKIAVGRKRVENDFGILCSFNE